MGFIDSLTSQFPVFIQILASLAILAIVIVFRAPSYFKGSFSRSYKASVERLFLIISDRNIFREHRKALELVEDLTDKNDADAKPKWKEYSSKGAGYIIYQINRSVPNELLEVEMVESTFHMRAKFTYEISEDPDDSSLSLVTITEESNITNVIVKLIMSIGGRGANARRDLDIIESELKLQHEVYEEYKTKYEKENEGEIPKEEDIVTKKDN
ncbi:hypothetical protein BCR36DRAFT_404726 [Piromyces finnis]|uniref:Bet v1-like protein n=1 Tax=Piromyces finnis TaxID=1754191 RepID=A0A1Y1V8K8_9FUNG|nr:hypothetical protein BCR36DRAFT_404726 [Piromyces finnis]|eukprot:ORX49759.1 hypothetical protein BCR36DRAFT_404726 [Piromyces finnis]